MIYRRGDVVMVDHPFSDARSSKVRPMLIVQSDARNRLLNHSVVTSLRGFANVVSFGGPFRCVALSAIN